MCQPLQNDTGNVLSLSPVVVGDIVVTAPLDLTAVQPLLEAFDESALTSDGTHALARAGSLYFPSLVAVSNGTIFVSTSAGTLQAWVAST